MQQLGFELPDVFARNPFLTWASITAYGREGPWSNYVGFGDDAAAAGGLLAQGEDGRLRFIGDAIADPLAGIYAATAAFKALSEGGGVLLDVSLREAAAAIAAS
jgi:crotonobetainyl-CoA:carnitine CoA-transferase CaiB-like acyl-CoA transferase